MKLHKTLFYIFTLVWLMDFVLTVAFTIKLGVDMEANPVVKWVIMELGYLGFALFKLITWLAWKRLYEEAHWIITAIFVTITSVAVILSLNVLEII